ncbi:hypothetical protein WJX73_005175 [Symbiochloris irregularis]|uniref:Sm domain-containing protein n=1 Tax=Symbiochloris irregularis TaxID=706552 RepID=A0AAW1NK59_9CHLO
MAEISSVAAQPEAEIVTQGRQLIAKRVRVNVRDGRELVGELQCIDKEQNLLLAATWELVRDKAGNVVDQKQVGAVLVPLAVRAATEIEVMPSQLEAMQQLLAATSR